MNDGGPAFPTNPYLLIMSENADIEQINRIKEQFGKVNIGSQSSMSLRDYFAGQALKEINWE